MTSIRPYMDTIQDNHESYYDGIYEKSPVPLERLDVVSFSYVNFEGQIKHNGELVVLDAISEHVHTIMETLLERQFPLHMARRIDEFHGCDDASMAANNSSAFNCRELSGQPNNSQKPLMSLHAYGVAIDINPIQNPFLYFASPEDQKQGKLTVKPQASTQLYVNRHRAQKDNLQGLVEDIVDVFFHHGLHIWGGNWNDPIDWHHFQTSRAMAHLLAVMTPQHAKEFFRIHVDCLRKHQRTFIGDMSSEMFLETSLEKLYQTNPEKFMDIFAHNPAVMASSDIDATLTFLQNTIHR